MRNIHIPLNEGDWVSGKTAGDEKFRGYVERIDPYGSFVKVRVLESDRDAIIGTTVEAPVASVAQLNMEGARTAAELLDLIDLALQTRDKAWFDELTAQLAALGGGMPNRRGLRPDRNGTVPKSRVG